MLGVGVAWGLDRLERLSAFGSSERYGPLLVMTVALLVFTAGAVLGANLFLGAFAAGITLATVSGERAARFELIGSTLSELLKLAAIFILGVSVTRDMLALSWGLVGFVGITLFVARPAGIAVALHGSPFGRAACAAIAWFGPKGFASVTFSLLVLHRQIAEGHAIVHAATLVIVVSMLLHSSTDVPIAHRLAASAEEEETEPAPSR